MEHELALVSVRDNDDYSDGIYMECNCGWFKQLEGVTPLELVYEAEQEHDAMMIYQVASVDGNSALDV